MNFESKFFGRFCSLFELVEYHTEKDEKGRNQTIGVKKQL